MKNSYLTAGMRAGPLLRLLSRNPISLEPAILFRLAFLLQSSIWSSLFTRIERTRFDSVLKKEPFVEDPVFIVGHWRTGSTLLHQLMSRDPNLTAPTLFQVALPEHFLSSYAFYFPLFAGLMGKTRPMDNVTIGMNEPQEDEYALFRLTSFSPLEQIVFPAQEKRYFLTDARFLPPDDDRQSYTLAMQTFFTKIAFKEKKQIVSKNPFNSFRIPFLRDCFPQARFIHIVRHPYRVVPSSQHLWNILQKQNKLNTRTYTPEFREIALFLSRTMEEIDMAFSSLPPDRAAVIRYEELESDPVETLRNLYSQLKMPFTDPFREHLQLFLPDIKEYRKNAFTLASDDKAMIAGIMKSHMDRFSYPENE